MDILAGHLPDAGDGGNKNAPLPGQGTNAWSVVPPLLGGLQREPKNPPVLRRVADASLTLIGYNQILIYTLCPDNGGNSGAN